MTGKRKPVYGRILLKFSGESLSGDLPFGIDANALTSVAEQIRSVVELGVEVAVVVGSGNLFRGAALTKSAGLERVTADQMGMLATVMNALALRDVLEQSGLPTRIMSATPVGSVVELYERRRTLFHLSKGRVVIFAAGTGNPFFTTDSAASLRAIEINADILLKSTKVDGIYSADPELDPDAKRFEHLTYRQVLDQSLGVMDLTAICLCREYTMPIRVFSMHDKQALLGIVLGESFGTLVEEEGE